MKRYEVPLASELLEIIAGFGTRYHVTPIKMLAVLGASVIDLEP
jgi:hypothetical protein